MRTIILDIDGTLADDRYRRDVADEVFTRSQRNTPEWLETYFTGTKLDQPLTHTVEFARPLLRNARVLFVTGRPEKLYFETMAWIEAQFGELENFSLLMRPDTGRLASLSSPELKVALLGTLHVDDFNWSDVEAAYDDRVDVLKAYRKAGCTGALVVAGYVRNTHLHDEAPDPDSSAPALLRQMATTYEERNKVYGDNFRRVGPIMRILFPDGVPPELIGSDHFHLFELKIVKLTRFAISGLTHVDSIHDDGVYSAMIESSLREKQK